jgi:hypothetical protein
MSKRIMTKLISFTFALMLTLMLTINLNSTALINQTDLVKPCMVVKSNLPMNHNNHPCNATYTSNQSWWSWASSDNKSVHLHFLDLTELMHHSFY